MQKSKNNGAQGAKKVKGGKKGKSKGPQWTGGVPRPIAALSSKDSANLGDGIVVRHREFVANVQGNNSVFQLLGLSAAIPGYDINPGCGTMFPWLSGIALNYEKYRFEALRFDVVPRNPSSLAGALYAGIDYDWDDIPAATEGQLMSNRGAISSDIWTKVSVPVDCARINQDMPYRYVAASAKGDSAQRQVFAGYFMIGIAGTAATVSFDIFVDYTVRLSLPALHTVDESGAVALPEKTLVAGVPNGFVDIPKLPSLQVVTVGVDVPNVPNLVNAKGYRLPLTPTGALLSYIDMATGGATPASFAADTTFDWVLASATGSTLTNDLNAYMGQSAWQTVKSAANWLVNGLEGRAWSSLDLDRIRKQFPTASYIIPKVVSAAGRVLTAGNALSTRYTSL